MQKITVNSLKAMKAKGEKISALTAYDALFAAFLDESEIEIILVGDSVAMVVGGHENTLPGTLDEMIYHTKAVRRAVKRAFLVADMPFMSYQISQDRALENIARVIKESGAECVKIEGGQSVLSLVARCTEIGIPIMGHLGMTPQSVHRFGGYPTQGKSIEQEKQLLQDAQDLEKAGVVAIVLEKIPAVLAQKISQSLSIPTIGIGAGHETDGQILVTQDMLGMFEKFNPKFVRHYRTLAKEIKTAISEYKQDVKTGHFPSESESY